MKKHTELMEPDQYYHIFNRGVNNEILFKNEKHYEVFLNKYAKYIALIADTYAYCLLKNHFHFCIKILPEEQIRINIINFEIVKENEKYGKVVAEKLNRIEAKIKEKPISWQIGNVFSSFFKSYTQTINFEMNRTGGLFEDIFRRIEIDSDSYLTQLIYYIHSNPQKHKFINDFKIYPHSSYKALLSNLPTKLKREEVWKWFGNRMEFEKYHLGNQILLDLDKFELE